LFEQGSLSWTSLCPKPRRAYSKRWTPSLRARFLSVLEDFGDVSAAVKACGLSRQSVYKLRHRDGRFAEQWAAALSRVAARLDAEARAFTADLRARAAAQQGRGENFPWIPSTDQLRVNQQGSW
jgi:hypothetical protein